MNENRYQEPKDSLWGEVQTCTQIAEGMFQVDTAGHGGIMVHKNVLSQLSAAAKKVGETFQQYRCYEEDCNASVVFRELLDRPEWKLPDGYSCTKERFEGFVDKSLEQWNKPYLNSRNKAKSAGKKEKETVR